MEFLITYFMPALPVFIAFVAIWWFLTIYVLASSIRSASRVNDIEKHQAGPKRSNADVRQSNLRKAA